MVAESFSRLSNIPNKFLYNAGAELNEISGNYETFYRHYDPVLGRFNSIDPLASSFTSLTPYQYANNDPILYNDPLGDKAAKPGEFKSYNNYVGSKGSAGANAFLGRDLRASQGSGYFWADGITRSDWTSTNGSESYRAELAFTKAYGGYEWQGVFYNRQGKKLETNAAGEVGYWEDRGAAWDSYDENGYPVVEAKRSVWISEKQVVTITSNRFLSGDDATLSKFTAESPNTEQTVEGYFLEPGGPSTTTRGQDKSIPAGKYTVQPYSSTNHPDSWIIFNEDVSKDRYILIHKGNLPCHTEGCHLPGSNYGFGSMLDTSTGETINNTIFVQSSGNTYTSLAKFLKENGSANITLIINDIAPGP